MGEYTTVTGDSLRKIAGELYNDSSRWQEIYIPNRSIIGSDPNLLNVGVTLDIPNWTAPDNSEETSATPQNIELPLPEESKSEPVQAEAPSEPTQDIPAVDEFGNSY